MADIDGINPSDVIEQVKYALNVAQMKVGEAGLGFKLGSVTLELTVVQTSEANGGIKLKIPYVDWELGAAGKIATESTQVISITLAPPERKVETNLDAPPLDIPLSEALLQIAQVVNDADNTEPRLVFDQGDVTMQFVVTKEGQLTLLALGAAKTNVTTQKLVVELAKL